MGTRRERAKAPNVQLNKQLVAAEEAAKLQRASCKRNQRKSEFYTDLAKLVFAGIIIGGLFESTKYSLLLYIGGIVGFFIFIRLGNKYFEQSLKE